MFNTRVFSVQPVIQLLGRTTFWTSAYFYFIRSLAVLLVVGSFVQTIQNFSVISKFSAVGIFGAVIFEGLFFLNIALLSQLLWIRAEDFKYITADDYTLLRIGAKLSRVFGEAFAIGVGLYSIGSGILYWFAGYSAWRLVHGVLPAYPIFSFFENNFIHGLTVMILGTMSALVVLIVSFLIAQTLLVLVDNAKRLSQILPGQHE